MRTTGFLNAKMVNIHIFLKLKFL